MVVRSKSLKLGRCSHSKKKQTNTSNAERIQIKTDVAESKAIQRKVNQLAIQAATAMVMVLRDADAGPRSGACAASLRKVYR